MDPVDAGIFGIIREAAEPLGLTMRIVSAEEFEEQGRRGFLRLGRRFHITVSCPGYPKTSCWPLSEDAARSFFAGAVDRHRERPGVRIRLIDEAERTVLAAWPEEPSC